MPAITNYLDLDLLVEKEDEGYRARVIDSPGGQATTVFQPPFSPLELENFLLRVGMSLTEIRRNVRRIDSSDMAEMKNFGGRLFRAIFDEQLRPALVRSLDEARRRQAGLRIRLRLSEAPELIDFPWEYLYDPIANRFLNLSVETPLIRYLDLPEPGRPLTVQPPLKILVMISGPSDVARLDIDTEWSRITSALADLEARGMVAVERLENATMASLQRALRRGEYHIFHFVGHGGYDEQSQDGVLLLEGMDGRSRQVSGQDLGTLLHDHRSLRLVVLNSCEGARTSPTDPFAGAAQSLVQQGIPAVIAMQFEITDEAAITLSHEFYSALADGYAVDTALGEARKAIFASGNEVEWGTPVLHMRSVNGRIFRMQHSQARPAPAEATEGGEPADEPLAATKVAEKSAAVEIGPVQVGPVDDVPVEDVPVEEVEDDLDPEPTVSRPRPVRAAEVVVASQAEDLDTAPTAMKPPPPAEPAARTSRTRARSAPTMLATQLSLVGAAVLLIGLGLSSMATMQGSAWFVIEPLLTVAAAAAFGVQANKGRQPAWAGGALMGLGLYVVAVFLPLINTPDHGVMGSIAVMTFGAALIVAAGVSVWRSTPMSEPQGVGWLAATGGLVIALALFLPVTSEDGPRFFGEMGFWVVGSQRAFLLPLLFLAGWAFLLSLYPSRRVHQQRGQIMALGVQLAAYFLSLAAAATFTQGWGTSYGLWLAVAGAGLVVTGVLRARGYAAVVEG